MDITITCPKCSAQITVSDAAEQAICRQCNETIPINNTAQESKQSLSLGKLDHQPAKTHAPAPGSVAATLARQEQEGAAIPTRGADHNLTPESIKQSLAHRDAMKQAMSLRRATIKGEQWQAALISGGGCSILMGLLIFGVHFGSAGTAGACGIAILVAAAVCGAAVLFVSFMDGFKAFLFAGCLPMVANALPFIQYKAALQAITEARDALHAKPRMDMEGGVPVPFPVDYGGLYTGGAGP